MNKRERWLKGNFKFKKRLKNLRLSLNDPNSNYNCYRTTGKPCSCPMCSPSKLGDKRKYKVKYKKQIFGDD